MKKLNHLSLLLLLLSLSGCEMIGTIFKGGMWFGVIIVVVVISLIIYLFGRSKK